MDGTGKRGKRADTTTGQLRPLVPAWQKNSEDGVITAAPQDHCARDAMGMLNIMLHRPYGTAAQFIIKTVSESNQIFRVYGSLNETKDKGS